MAQSKAFGDFLREAIKASGITQSAFYAAVGITKPYFYDILSGKINPPPAEVQFRMVEALTLDEDGRNTFFDLAAEARGEIPADVAKLILDHPERRAAIRAEMERLLSRRQMEVWQL